MRASTHPSAEVRAAQHKIISSGYKGLLKKAMSDRKKAAEEAGVSNDDEMQLLSIAEQDEKILAAVEREEDAEAFQ
jgi:hypothetical protein